MFKCSVQKQAMKALTLVTFSAAFLVTVMGLEDDFGTNINKLLAPFLNCLKQRNGVVCPAPNETESCVSSTNPLTQFYLFTPRNTKNPEFLQDCGGRLPANTYFDTTINTEVLIHGYLDGVCRTEHWREMKDQLFFRGDYNVLIVDWSRENIPDAYDALNTNKIIGKRTACVIRNIIKQTGVSKLKIHIVGHSMGAHIAGFTGQGVPGLRRITGLDPSNFGYYGYPRDERLSDDDALLVDSIHSNIGDCYPIHIGYKDPLGHTDFFPNGGSIQPSCFPYIFTSLIKGDIFYAGLSVIPSYCFHLESLQYYKASINPCGCQFVGVKCPNYESFQKGSCKSCKPDGSNCAVMGMDWEYYYRGSSGDDYNQRYYLDTTLFCPYCDNRGIVLNGFPKSAEKINPGLHCFENKK